MDKKPLVMIIDDEKNIVHLLAYQFKARGYDVETAANGVEGLEKLAKVAPDLIVLDLNMPKMGGVDFFQQISGADGRSRYPVLVLTARANMEQLFKELDVDGFMSKPFQVDELIHEADIIIKKRMKASVGVERKKGLQQIYLIDDDVVFMEKIALGVLRAGYGVACAQSGTAGLELLSLGAPALAVVKLGLPDISGDLVALKALRMAKTDGVKFLLYEKQDMRHLQAVRHQIGDKSGVIDLVEYDTAEDLIQKIKQALQNSLVRDVLDSPEVA